MKNRTISHPQLLTVVTLALFPLGTEVLFSRLAPAGAAGWLCPLAAGGVAVLLVVLLKGRCRTPERMNRVLAGGLLLWGMFFGGAQACRIGVRLSDPLGASPILLTAAVLLLAAWMAAGGLPAFARACQIFLPALGGATILILLAGVFSLQWDWVLLWTARELAQVPLGALECLGLLSVGCYGLLLIEDVAPQGGGRGRICRMIGRIALLLGAVEVLILGRFGPALVSQMDRPFLQMVSGLGLEGAFQRLEQLASALWVLGDLALLGFLFLCLAKLMGRLAGQPESTGWVWLLGAGVFLLALPVTFWQEVLEGPILWVGNLSAGVLILAHFGLKKKK